jgi:hypothetical protein
MKFFLRVTDRLELFFHKAARFGFQAAFWDQLDSLKGRIRILPGAVTEKKHAAILKWLGGQFGCLIADFSGRAAVPDPPLNESAIPACIWVCWWDGIETMPPLVRACFNSVRKNAGACRVRLITKYNYHEYAALPDHVMRKFRAGAITKTHLSDILRMALLAAHGGFWLDATVLVTGTMGRYPPPLFTIKKEFGGEDVPRQRWTGFCVGGTKDNIWFVFVRELLYEYWKKNDHMIDYFLIDYALALGYNFIPAVRRMVDMVPLNNPDLYLMYENLENPGEEDLFDAIRKNTMFHKLNWKKTFPVTGSDHALTMYGYILKKYGP